MKKTLFLIVALLTAMTAWASTFSVTNSGNTFIITRSSSSGTESVYYRTLSLSAMAGVHFTDAVGTLNFQDGESEKTVTVTETPIDSIAEQYLFQTGTMRTYRFEVLDEAGFRLASCDRDITYGPDYQHTANYVNKSVTDLVYFDNSGNIKSGSGNKYLDVAYSSPDWIRVTDAGYLQGVHTVSTDGLYHGSSVLRTYLDNQLNKMYATVYFTQKEDYDGYQFIQILADDSTNYDQDDPGGEVYDPSISLYKACFELSYTGGYVTDAHQQFFPHRYDYVNKAAETGAGLSRYSFDYDNSYLYEQKYQSPDYDAPNTGSLNLAPTVNDLNIRFDASGNSSDDWDFKDLKVRLALVDNTAPTVLNNYQVSGGLHSKGNMIYVSVPFSEIVTVSGTTSLSSRSLNTTWGTLYYVSGGGTNVLTFRGTIADDASGTFAVNSHSGTINDLAGNSFSGSISHNFGISLDSQYSITYDLAGGTLPEGQSNPEAYTKMTATFTLNNPTRPGYAFTGWTGSNGDTPQTVVTIEQGSEGDRNYTANWERLPRYYTYDSQTGALALLWGEFNSDNKWGNDVPRSNVLSVSATNEVSFTGDCTGLFAYFNNCKRMDLNSVNTSQMTNAYGLFCDCLRLDTLDISGWDTRNVTNMKQMFLSAGITTLNLSGWDTGNVTNMGSIFQSSKIESIDLSGWNTGKVTDMSGMFYNCSYLRSANLSGWELGNVNMNSMFQNCDTLTSVDLSGWNTSNVTDMGFMFYNCKSLQSIDLSEWNTANVYNMAFMFGYCTNLTTIYAGLGWSNDNVIYSNYMFDQCTALVGGKGTTFDPSHTDAEYARIDKGASKPGYLTIKLPRYTYDSATGALSLLLGEFNSDDKWGDEVVAENVTSVTTTSYVNFTGDCSGLFSGFTQCGSIDLYLANMSEITDANGMFMNCMSLDTLDLSLWNTANVTDMANMFKNCSQLSTIYVGLDWNTEIVESSIDMFDGCTSLVGGMGTAFDPNYTDKTYARIDGGLNNPGYLTAKYPPRYIFDTETGMLRLIWGEFNKDDKWGNDVVASSVTSVTATNYVSFTGDCSGLFSGFNSCESMDLSNVNTSEMTNCYHMFYNCTGLDTLNLSGFNTGNVTDMSGMFYGCTSLTSLDLSGWNTGKVTNMEHMFLACMALPSIDISHFNTANVTNMFNMFYYCISLKSLDLSNWNTANVTSMWNMFYDCTSLETLNLSGWVTDSLRSAISMFENCSSLKELDLSSWNTAHVELLPSTFRGCKSLTTIYGGAGWSFESLLSSSSMFYNCTSLVGGMGTTYNQSHIEADYAHIDGGPDNPGYFTAKSTFLRGDVDGDGNVGISDVTALIDYILSGDASGINLEAADCDQDDSVGISDVTALIDYILSGSW